MPAEYPAELTVYPPTADIQGSAFPTSQFVGVSEKEKPFDYAQLEGHVSRSEDTHVSVEPVASHRQGLLTLAGRT
jgi:hypothetical protein